MYLLLRFFCVALHGLEQRRSLFTMAILILKLFHTCHNGLFIPGKGTPVTVAKAYSNEGSMPTARIQPIVKLPLATAST